MFAGPNGSGKSTLIDLINTSFSLGYFINADNIQKIIETQKYLDCSQFCPRIIEKTDLDRFYEENQNDQRFINFVNLGLEIENNILVCKKGINSYSAALLASFFIDLLLQEDSTLSFETVMSHSSKVELLKNAAQAGYKTYLYFICTKDPEINKNRVINRVLKGGHAVDQSKIESRYYRSLDLLFDAFCCCERVFILDTSEERGKVVLEKDGNIIKFKSDTVPDWVQFYLLDKLNKIS